MTNFWHRHQTGILTLVVVILLLADVLAQLSKFSYALKLIPVILAIVTVIVLLAWDNTTSQKVSLAIIAMIGGFLAEAVINHLALTEMGGLNSSLGIKLLGLPLVFGVIWFLISLSAWQIVSFGKLGKLYQFCLAGFLVMMFGVLFEEFLFSYNIANWLNGWPLLWNYLTWFLIAEALFLVYHKLIKKLVPSLFVAVLLPLITFFFWLMIVVH